MKNEETFLPAEIKDTEKSVVVYRSSDGEVQLEVILYNETLWLDVHQMSQLFDRDEKTIRKHINKALIEELCDEVVVANFAITTKHGAIAGKSQTHDVSFYNLYMIFSVGYRVKSKARFYPTTAFSPTAKFSIHIISFPIWLEKPRKKSF